MTPRGSSSVSSYPNSSSDTCATSGAGTASPPSGDVTYTYDTFGRLSSIVTWVTTAPSTYLTLTYAYDCAGNLYWTSTGTTSGAPCTASNPAPLAPPTASSAVTTQYGYANGVDTSIATSTGNGGTPLLGFTLAYGANNLLSSSTPKTNTTALAPDTYTYTTSNQVETGPITGSTGSDSYSYSPVNDSGSPDTGSISADTTAFSSAAYSQNGELCWSIGSSSTNACGSVPTGASKYTYDASGDRLTAVPGTGNSQALGWEQASERLVCYNTNGTTCSTSSPTSTTTINTYNGDGERATSTLGAGATTTFVWDALQDRALSNGQQDFIYGLNASSPVLQITLNGSNPVVDLLCQGTNSDTRGIVQLAGGTGSYTGTLVAYVDYDAYGNPITQSGGSVVPGGLTATTGGYTYSTTPFGFGASYSDQTGLSYLVNRYFDPTTAQFISVDPDLNATGQPYEYASDQPQSEFDPLGTKTTKQSTIWAQILDMKHDWMSVAAEAPAIEHYTNNLYQLTSTAAGTIASAKRTSDQEGSGSSAYKTLLAAAKSESEAAVPYAESLQHLLDGNTSGGTKGSGFGGIDRDTMLYT